MLRVVVGVLKDRGQYMAVRRAPHKAMAGPWCPPSRAELSAAIRSIIKCGTLLGWRPAYLAIVFTGCARRPASDCSTPLAPSRWCSIKFVMQRVEQRNGFTPRHGSTSMTSASTSRTPALKHRPVVTAGEKVKPQQPPLYAVILLNDDYTPRYFVTQILKRHFGLDGDAAETIMMHAHCHGEARVGAWQKDIAESKIHAAEEESREEGHPLTFRCVPVEP